MKKEDWKKLFRENSLVNEATNKVILKPKELGEGVPTEVYIDDEGDLVIKNKEGGMIFLSPYQTTQLHKFLMKNKIKY